MSSFILFSICETYSTLSVVRPVPVLLSKVHKMRRIACFLQMEIEYLGTPEQGESHRYSPLYLLQRWSVSNCHRMISSTKTTVKRPEDDVLPKKRLTELE